jgi:hypothetical protein
MIWATTTIALTEIPAMFFASLAVIATERTIHLASSKEVAGNRLQICLLGFAAGTCLGLAILGRQSYLVAIPLMFMPFLNRKNISSWAFVTLPILIAFCIVAGPLFWIWGG